MRGRPQAILSLAAALAGGVAGACGSKAEKAGEGGASASASLEPSASISASAPASSASAAPSSSEEVSNDRPAPLLCPKGMVAVPRGAGLASFCIDRYEASLIDRRSREPLSPYYPPHRKLAQRLHDRWETERFTAGGPSAQALPVPLLPAPAPSLPEYEPLALSVAGAIPNGYLSGLDAELACKNAGKRLCKHEEWIRACKGQRQLMYPYGDTYRHGVCNIFRSKHPAAELHDDASIGHLDPRLNLVKDERGDRLLRLTGGTPGCKSEWGSEAIFDMNGNIDEWVDDDKGRFDGGFFSRSKKDGCLSSVGAHPKGYFDYSTGARCCLSLGDAPAPPESPEPPLQPFAPGEQGPKLGPEIKPFPSAPPGPTLGP